MPGDCRYSGENRANFDAPISCFKADINENWPRTASCSRSAVFLTEARRLGDDTGMSAIEAARSEWRNRASCRAALARPQPDSSAVQSSAGENANSSLGRRWELRKGSSVAFVGPRRMRTRSVASKAPTRALSHMLPSTSRSDRTAPALPGLPIQGSEIIRFGRGSSE